jgi:hypothetical protein
VPFPRGYHAPAPRSRAPRHKGTGRPRVPTTSTPWPRSPLSATAFTAPPAAALAPFRHRSPLLRFPRAGHRRAVPSTRRRLHREVGRAAFLTPVRSRRALSPRAASRAPMRFLPRLLPLCRLSVPPSCRCSGAVARARARATRMMREARPARPWAARTLRRMRPSRSRLGHAHTAQVGCAGTVQLGRGGFGRATVELFFYFPNIFKSLQIQKFV